MNYKFFGAICIIAACGWVGFCMVTKHLHQERTLRQLVHALDYMECELQYRLTPLPDLCRQAAQHSTGVIQSFFLKFATELEDQIHPDTQRCLEAAFVKVKNIPPLAYEALTVLGSTLGTFNLEGQLKGLEAARAECRNSLSQLRENRDIRLRNYQTLGLCTGAALAILFI